ncbi:36432_t:CDS:1, partial [Racocetra persica]
MIIEPLKQEPNLFEAGGSIEQSIWSSNNRIFEGDKLFYAKASAFK